MNSADSSVLEQAKTYHQIKRDLARRLGEQWPVGARLPPIKQLALQLRTGQTNTHRAVQELVREGLLVSQPGQGTFVTPLTAERDNVAGDEAPPRAGALAGKTIRVLTAAVEPEPFIVRAIKALEHALEPSGCTLERGRYRFRTPNLAQEHAEADGVVVLNPDLHSELVTRPGQPLVVINTAIETPINMEGGYDIVSVDNEQGGLLAGRHLRRQGCRSVAFIGCGYTDNASSYDLTSGLRLMGLERGLGERLPESGQLRLNAYVMSHGARAVPQFLALDPRPEAIFAAADELALGFIHGAWGHGLEPGRDYRIIGFDGQQRGRELVGGPLTTIDAPMPEMGRLAAQLLTGRFAQPERPVRRVLLGCRLFEGAT